MAEEKVEPKVIIIGGSAGSVNLLVKIMPKIPKDYPLTIIVVLHRKVSQDSSLADVLNAKTKVPVKEIDNNEPILPGVVYIAPADYHLLIEADHTFSLDYSEKINFSRPNIDVSMINAAHVYGKHLIGVLLTGANEDGARGMKAIQAAGGYTIVQDLDSAEVRIMPEAADRLIKPNAIMNIKQLGGMFKQLIGRTELKKSETHYKGLFDKMSEGLFFTSPAGIISFVNPQFSKMFGYTTDELIGENSYEMLLEEEYRANIIKKVKDRQLGTTDQYEACMLHKNGKGIWVSVSASPNYSSEGDFIGVMSLVSDVTEKKDTELRKQVSYNIAKASNKIDLDVKTLSTIIHKEIGTFLDATNTFIALYNDETNDITFPFFVDSKLLKKPKVHPYLNRKFSDGITEFIISSKKPILLSGKGVESFYENTKTEQKFNLLPKSIAGVPLKMGDRVTGVLVVLSYKKEYVTKDLDFLNHVSGQVGNLFERIGAQEEVARSQKKYSTLFNKMQEGLLHSDENGIINMVNPYLCEMLGYAESELIGQNGYELLHSKQVTLNLKDKIINRKKGQSEKYEIEFITKSKKTLWAEISSSPHTDINGNFLGVMSLITNITERKTKEKELIVLYSQGKNSENQYKALVAESPVAILLIEPVSEAVIETNEALNNMLGYSMEAIKDMTLSAMIVKKDWVRLQALLKNLKQEEKGQIELQFTNNEGSIVFVDATISKTMYGDALSVIMINLFDITKRKRAQMTNDVAFSISTKAIEKELSTVGFCEFIRKEIAQSMDSTEFYIAQAMDNETISFPYIYDRHFKKSLPLTRKRGNGLIEYIIKTGNSLFLNEAEILPFLQEAGLDQNGTLPKCWIGAPLLSTGKVFGAIACQSYSKSDLYNEDHIQLLALVGSYLGPFFERKMHNNAIKKSEERFRALYDNSSDITCLYDVDGVITYASPSIETVLGYKPQAICGKSIFEFIHKDNVGSAIEEHTDQLKREGKGESEVRMVKNIKGEWRHLRIIVNNQMNNPSINSFIINAQDITDILHVQEKLEKQHLRALQYQSMLLSSQLNPHFIFNSLNSIQYYILEQETKPALDYLSNFATLMRSVLDNSTKPYITLYEELKFLNVYLGLEETRHRNKFKHTITIGDDINPHDMLIPPMLLQPYIENTVIHGVGNLVKGGKIDIVFKRKGKVVECSITDNGVGREKAQKLKGLRTLPHTSLSTKITNTRLDILNTLGDFHYSEETVDLVDKKNKVIGTKVLATFPYMEENE